MKKFLLGALVAVTTLFMASCKDGGSSNYTAGGPEPTINTEAGTVNGTAYDNKTEYCWEVTETASASYGGATAKETETFYTWCTEFQLVATMEQTMWSVAQEGYVSATYSYSKNNAKDSESCLDQNVDDEDW